MSLPLVVQLLVDGVWTDYPGLSEEGWEVNIGPDVESGLRANSLSITLDNDDLSLDPTNVSSPLYGKIGRNTRARVRIAGSTLTQAEASSWQPDRTVEHAPSTKRGLSWTVLQAEGLLRRLGRWTDPIRSAMTRRTLSYASLVGFWTLEDPTGSGQLSNEIAAALPGTYSGSITLQGDDGPGGSGGALELGSDTVLAGQFVTVGGSGYQISWSAKLTAIPTTTTWLALFSWKDADGRTWTWQVSSIGFQVTIVDQAGALVDSTLFGPGVLPVTAWTRYRVKVTVSGSTVTYEPAIYQQDATVTSGVTDTFTATTAGRPTTWTIVGNLHTNGAAVGHVFAITDTALNLFGGDEISSFNGYLGETAVNRYARLMSEEGLVRYLVGSSLASTPMGRQKPGIFLDLLTECVVTEAGMIFDEPNDIGLTMFPYRALINRTPMLALTKAQIQAPLRKVVDDVGVVNDVTVKNSDGSSSRATLDVGALSTAVPPAGVGRVKGTVDVNYQYPADLAGRANWELRKGTLDRPRYLSVSVNLLANPSLSPTIVLMRPGDIITVTGIEPDLVTLRVISIKRAGGAVEDIVTFNCLPAELYNVGIYDDAGSRIDSGSSTLAAAITTTTQTAVSLTTAIYEDQWSTTSLPYDIKIAGERMTVTAMTAPAGTGPYTQTATVTRAVNGVQKTHTAATEVHIFAPVRYALK